LSETEIREALVARGEPGYRARQICEWLYRRRAKSFDEMTNLPVALRAQLAEAFTIPRLHLAQEMISAHDGTTKVALALADGNRIEMVYLPHRRGATLCISTQVGCAFKCRFCATGKMGLKRNLTAGEIVDQVLFAKEHFRDHPAAHPEELLPGAAGGIDDAEDDEYADDGPEHPEQASHPEHTVHPEHQAAPEHPAHTLAPDERPFTNIVLMGMGEPLANYENVVKAIDILMHEVGIGSRRITISTAGVADKIMLLAERPDEVGLAISLNTPSDEVRRDIMPVAAKTTLGKLMNAARYYVAKKGRMLTFEYILIPELNDSLRDAHALASLTRDIPAKINLIAFNPFPGSPYERPDETRVKRFSSILRGRGKRVMLRRSLGCDILAACGQLGQRPGGTGESEES
jgi:23S rRNA (adenine2503-C2)-methyltransferase